LDEPLNHHQLRHFWTVVHEGGVTRASEKLHLSQPTISGQLRELEATLGERLLTRSGRTLVLTDIGRVVYRYADEMLTLEHELLAAVQGRGARPGELAVGIAVAVPKLIAYKMLEPALHLPDPIRLVCVQERLLVRLLAELANYAVAPVWAWHMRRT
jgi:LysR family transcriptional regulator, transcriptional activator of nhaA